MNTKLFFLVVCAVLYFNTVSAQQNAGIGTTTPDSTAMLDIKSSNKGFLMPRMTMAQRLAIPNPADGLQVFQTDTVKGVYAYIKKYQNWFIQAIQNNIVPVVNTLTYSYSDKLQGFIVPMGVKSVKIKANGAGGSTGSYSFNGFPPYYYTSGENGILVEGSVNVNPGDTILIITGQKANGITGGGPGGTNGKDSSYVSNGFPPTFYYYISGGGGGYTAVFKNDTTSGNLLLRCKGGKGGPSNFCPEGQGGGPQFIAGAVQNPVTANAPSPDASASIEWNMPSNIVTTNATADAYTTGLLSYKDWNIFNNTNKVGGSGNINQVSFYNSTNTISSSPSLKWDNVNAWLDVANIKINTLSGGSSSQMLAADTTGKLVTTSFVPAGDDMGNHTATKTIRLSNNFISNNGIKRGLRLDNNGYAVIGLDSTVTSFTAALTVNSLNNGTGISNWIASSLGGKTGSRVVSGLYNGMATIGANNYDLTAWNDLAINPGGNVAIGDINPLVKLHVNGTLRATNIGIGTTTPYRLLDVRGDIAQGTFTDNIPSRRIGVMNSVLQLGGMEIENTTLDGNYSQKLHLLTHHFGGTYGRRLTIDEDGKVGIGTTNPTNTLSVQGNANISGALTAGDIVTTAGASIPGAITANNISATTNATITGNLTAGNVTTAGTVSAVNVSTSNISTTTITSSKFKVTEVWNNVQGNPGLGNFTSGSGTLLLNISAMAYQSTGGPAALTIDVYMDGIVVATLKGFASQSVSQIPLTTNFKVITGLAAGNHNISIVPVAPTVVDINSYISASVLELPF
jgi:cytoskeletal protein CcmA (bactofilin family)